MKVRVTCIHLLVSARAHAVNIALDFEMQNVLEAHKGCTIWQIPVSEFLFPFLRSKTKSSHSDSVPIDVYCPEEENWF